MKASHVPWALLSLASFALLPAAAGQAVTFSDQILLGPGKTDRAFDVFAADLDGDGDLDVLSASGDYAASLGGEDDKIAWYENTDGAGTFGAQQVISKLADGARSVYAADLDGDDDLDVLSASWPTHLDPDLEISLIAWYENAGGGTFGEQQIIAQIDFAHTVFAADLDGDDDVDVLSASGWNNRNGMFAWYENLDGAGSFGKPQLVTPITEQAMSVYAADLDGDGDIDVLSATATDDKVAWYENLDGTGAFGQRQVIGTHETPRDVFAADVDADGDLDVLSAGSRWSGADSMVAWYENTGDGTFGARQVITTQVDAAQSVVAADVDADGDLDVLSASRIDNKIAWYENIDAHGVFGSQQVITTDADRAWSVFAADLDGDGDADVMSAGGDHVAWYRAESSALGDVNFDGNVNGLDVDPFVNVLLNGSDDNATQVVADMNSDGEVNGLDVDPFVAAVVGSGTRQIPEPSALLLGLVALGVVSAWRKWDV